MKMHRLTWPLLFGLAVGVPAVVRSAKPPEPVGTDALDPKIRASLKKIGSEPKPPPRPPRVPQMKAPPCATGAPQPPPPPKAALVDTTRRVPESDKKALRQAAHADALARIEKLLAHDPKALAQTRADLRHRLLGEPAPATPRK